jgi:glycerol-3-phosphate dehydrogenase
MHLSALNRKSILGRISSRSYDLLIIGGGITGAGIALDAALRGLTVLLVEKNDFAYGTSSRSTKLIHGGLRYLKQLEFGLVKEVGSERAILHRLAPHLVIPEKMLLPLKEGRGFGSILTSFGLKLYDWLANVEREDKRKMLNRRYTLQQEPLLKPEGINGGGLYAEYRTDDARLTIEIIKMAAFQGAQVLNYVQAEKFNYDTNNRIESVLVRDVLNEQSFVARANTVVNAAGPWVDTLRDLDGSKTGKKLHLTKGVHLVVSRKKLPVRQAIYFDVADGRMIFAIPRGFTTYIGTTDTDYCHGIDDVTTTIDDAQYLLDAVNEAFPDVSLTLNDIESSWAGLRPLIHEEGKSASELSRKDEIFESPSGLISIAGGKLTGYRKMAERIVDRVIKRSYSKRQLNPCATATTYFSGGPFQSMREVFLYRDALAHHLRPLQIEYLADYLVHTYGRQTDSILKQFDTLNDEDLSVRLARAEVWFCVHHEMVMSSLDFFIRRTGMLYFDTPRLQRVKDSVLLDMKHYLDWDQQHFDRERDGLSQEVRLARITQH